MTGMLCVYMSKLVINRNTKSHQLNVLMAQPQPFMLRHYTCCDLVAYNLVASYGIESSSILYNTYVTYNRTTVQLCMAHIVIYY